jgi:ring-1,2-phenylacetyl-CoA epoxidase subunit PaaE
MSKFHNIKIEEIYKTTKDCSVISFEIPKEIQAEFQYKQGQYLTLKADINGIEERRSYSLCSSPIENKWQIAVKKINGGIFSTHINENLKQGDCIEILPPKGNFTIETDKTEAKNYILFAAGSGITPILSIIKTHLAEEPDCTIKLFYLNRTVKSIIFKEEIEQLKNIYFERFEIFHFLTKENRNIDLLNGRFTKEKLQILTSKIIDLQQVDACFICGPQEMIFQINDHLIENGLTNDKIHFELFSTSNTEADKIRIKSILQQKIEGTEVTIIDGGKEFHFSMTDDHDNILDGALAAGADLPFACKGGVCCTCRCKIIEGTVQMKVNYALDEAEVAKGLILSCQAVPTSKNIVVEFGI